MPDPRELGLFIPDPTGLPRSLARDLAAARREMVYTPGEVMVRIGERCDPGVLLDGLLSQSIRSEDGRRATVKYVRKGESFAAESVFRPMSHMVIAVTDSRVVHYDRLVIEQLMRRHSALALMLASRLAGCMKEMDEAVAAFAFRSVAQRVVSHLAAVAQPTEKGVSGAVAHLSQQELADAVGSVREVVARVLRDLRARQIIETSRSGITITDELGLYRFGVEPSRVRASDTGPT